MQSERRPSPKAPPTSPRISYKLGETKPAYDHEGHAERLTTRGFQAESSGREHAEEHPAQKLEEPEENTQKKLSRCTGKRRIRALSCRHTENRRQEGERPRFRGRFTQYVSLREGWIPPHGATLHCTVDISATSRNPSSEAP